jgi:hypothetical protein
MEKLLIHQLSDEIKGIENENTSLKQQINQVQFFSLLMYLGWKTNTDWQQLHAIINTKGLTEKLHNALAWRSKSNLLLLSNDGSCVEASTMVKVETIEHLLQILES